MNQKFSEHLLLAQSYWNEFLRSDDHVIDATCGNGHDTLFLAQKVPLGKVYAFDIQKDALQNTRALLKKHLLEERVSLFLSSHENLSLVLPQKIRLIVYNLGYLPKGDKSLTTRASSTRNSLKQALGLIQNTQGAISIMCYPGHEEGKNEQEALLQELTLLDSSQWQVSYHQWINRLRSPCLFWIRNFS